MYKAKFDAYSFDQIRSNFEKIGPVLFHQIN